MDLALIGSIMAVAVTVASATWKLSRQLASLDRRLVRLETLMERNGHGIRD